MENNQFQLLNHLLKSFAEISLLLRFPPSNLSQAAGDDNTFGDHQLNIDLLSDKIIFKALANSGLVGEGSSEESPEPVKLNGRLFAVALDPLDGSSVVSANFAVGSILGVWPLANRRTGRDQVFSLMVVYGPSTSLVLAFTNTGGTRRCVELSLGRDDHWLVQRDFKISKIATTFAPGNLRAVNESVKYSNVIQSYIASSHTLRYSGALVPDVFHILVKGQGIVLNLSTSSHPAKLRLLYEAAPIALIIEYSLGECISFDLSADPSSHSFVSSNCYRVLDLEIIGYDQRLGLVAGSKESVEQMVKMMK